MSYVLSENGLVLSRLVFVMIQRFPILPTTTPGQKERIKALKSTQVEINPIVADLQVLKASSRNISSAAFGQYNLGGKVKV